MFSRCHCVAYDCNVVGSREGRRGFRGAQVIARNVDRSSRIGRMSRGNVGGLLINGCFGDRISQGGRSSVLMGVRG